MADGVDVVFDQYDLREGQDKYHFMEKMVTDPCVTHVLAFSDRVYAENSDARRAGVRTESQIVSKDIYGIKDDVIGRSAEALAERARFCEEAMRR